MKKSIHAPSSDNETWYQENFVTQNSCKLLKTLRTILEAYDPWDHRGWRMIDEYHSPDKRTNERTNSCSRIPRVCSCSASTDRSQQVSVDHDLHALVIKVRYMRIRHEANGTSKDQWYQRFPAMVRFQARRPTMSTSVAIMASTSRSRDPFPTCERVLSKRVQLTKSALTVFFRRGAFRHRANPIVSGYYTSFTEWDPARHDANTPCFGDDVATSRSRSTRPRHFVSSSFWFLMLCSICRRLRRNNFTAISLITFILDLFRSALERLIVLLLDFIQENLQFLIKKVF